MEAEMHRALAVPEIREHILQFCSRRDLLSCRLVSKDWRESSVKAWTSKARIRLADGRKMSGFLGFLKSEHAPRKPFAHFCLSYSLLSAKKTATRFWGICGENVKVLELSHCKFRSADDLRAVLFQLCPNMEKLSIEDISVMPSQRKRVVETGIWTEPKFGAHRKLKSLTVDCRASKDTGISWMEYFSHFSSLEVLRMQEERMCDPGMLFVVARIRHRDPSKLKLKQIRVCYHSYYNLAAPPGNLLAVLLDPGLQLESLVFCVNHLLDHNVQERATIRIVLKSHRASLRTLELNYHFQEVVPRRTQQKLHVQLDNFPGQFENLQKATFMSSSISSLNFLKFTPNLSKLFVKYDRGRPFCRIIRNTDFDGMGGAQLTKLETLELNFKEDVSSDDLQRLMELMPNVRKLKMPLDNSLFEMVCQRWGKLEALEIVRGEVDSFGLIGLKGCPLFLRRRKNIACIPFPTTTTVPKNPKANIACLKNLRTLSVEGPVPYGRYQGELPISLSHWAAHLGIEQLPYLEHLRLYNYNLETECGVWKRLLEQYPWPKLVNSFVSEENSD